MVRDPVNECLAPLRHMAFALSALAVAVVLAACSDAKPVGYYIGHPAEREAKLSACLARGDDGTDCQDARQAEFQVRGIPARDGRAVQASKP